MAAKVSLGCGGLPATVLLDHVGTGGDGASIPAHTPHYFFRKNPSHAAVDASMQTS